MTLTADRFSEFFSEIYGNDVRPYRWQEELLAVVLETGRWPEILDVPTGGGKSAVIDVHVFANAVDQARAENGSEAEEAPRIPRRLSCVVPRRSVVDQQLDRSVGILGRLVEAEDGILAEVRELLIRRSTPQGVPEDPDHPIRVHLLRGGTASVSSTGKLGSRRDEWVDYPAAVQILCATPDMLGSRMLFRGYGVSSRARPRSAGLLGYDHVSVIDEAHLSRQLLDTFRRVSAMASRWNPVSESVPAVQVCASTATHGVAEEGSRIGLDWEQLEPHLENVLTRPKPVEYREVDGWNGTSAAARKKHVASIMDAVEELRKEPTGTGTLGVVVNRVATAVAVQEAAQNAGLTTRLVVGPMRFGARQGLRLEDVDLVVATQTIEVGVDLDCAGMVTDLAPGSALVQRAGRVNRNGRQERARLVVLGPAGNEAIPERDSLPYSASDLREAREWIRARSHEPDGVSPANLRTSRIPVTADSRPVYSHLDAADVRLLSRTSESLVAEPDLTFWLRDSLDPESPEIRVIGRRLPSLDLGEDSEARSEMVDATFQLLPKLVFEDTEVYPSTPDALRKILQRGDVLGKHQAWVRRGDEWALLQETDSELPHSLALRDASFTGGELVVLDSEMPCTLGTDGQSSTGASAPGAVLNADGHRPIGEAAEPATTGVHVFYHGCAHVSVDSSEESAFDALIAQGVREDGTVDATAFPAGVLDVGDYVYDVEFGPETSETDGEPAWAVCTRRVAEAQNEPLAESGIAEPVLLTSHQADVAQRASALAQVLGLREHVADALYDAGLHHDDGKSSPVFQAWIRSRGTRLTEGLDEAEIRRIKARQRSDSSPAYAKSVGLIAQESHSGPARPPGWRHEMLSVSQFWAENGTDGSELPERLGPREMAAWLIGTHHGEGRSGFPISSDDVVLGGAEDDVVTAARAFFAEGLWDDLALLVDHELGPWGAAYVEAVLRAADGTISQEGR